MTSLEWCELAEKFYAFKTIATPLGFYVPEMAGMEDSLYKCRPFAKDEDAEEKVKTLHEGETPQLSAADFPEAHPPEFDDNDELAEVGE